MTRAGHGARRAAAALLCPLALAAAPGAAVAQAPPFVVTDTSVREGSFVAVARSRDTIVSTYPRAAREVHFRFSIDGLENEFPPGTDHTIFLRPTGGRIVTPLYAFGTESAPPPPVAGPATTSEEGTAQVTFRVDLRHVRQAVADSGRWVPRIGEPVTRRDFRVYVRGTPEPLTWDLDKLVPGSVHELTDPDGDGVFEGTVPLAAEYTRPQAADGQAIWARSRDVGAFPQLRSAQRLQDALYRLSLEELTQLVRDDGALMAGAKWLGVWTRDISLAGILSLSIVAPDALRASLLAKVDSAGRIIQDTGTGGSWPVSTDRMVWALAAWELYAATGDTAWLRRAHDVTRRSALADLHAARDARTGLFHGESSFLDWREQSYPRWMQPADIYTSQNLGTNAIHHGAYRVLARMARALGEPEAEARRWDAVADAVAAGMSAHLWDAERRWFGQYRYGRVHLALSPRAESLGESLASVYGAATPEQRQALARTVPVSPYGAPSFWPFIAGERFYHNAAIWPFVTAYATWAAAEGRGTSAVRQGLDANTRAAALFLTNKENMVASTGNYEGTALNSDRQLWSVAGTIAGTYRVLLGMRLEPEAIRFSPMVPPSYGGERTLTGLRYRGMTLDVTVRGHGDAVASAVLDGRPIERAEVPASLTGAHRIELTMNGRWTADTINVVPPVFAPATPRVALDPRCTEPAAGCPALRWRAVPGAVRYVVHVNGDSALATADTTAPATTGEGLREYQVLAVDSAGLASYLSEPLRVLPAGAEMTVKPAGVPLEREHRGFTGDGYVRLTTGRNVRVDVPLTLQGSGSYAVDVRYANGNGPVNTDSKAAVRTLLVGGDTAGVLVMPQRGVDAWTDWGWSNALHVRLPAGTTTLALTYGPLDANMDLRENTALLDVVRVTRLAEPAAGYAPSRDLGALFHAVQTGGVFEDSKTFVDARPLRDPAEIVQRWERERAAPGFDLAAFVRAHFALPDTPGADVRSDTSRTMEQHVRALWPALTREPDVPDARSSLLPLPHAYVVPGGRFREVYYWDSYFTMLGLVESGRTDLVRGMLDNFAHLVRTVGHVPNGNRTYYLSRSQPPYLAAMVGLYAEATDTAGALRWLDALEREHAFWTDGTGGLAPGTAHRRAVRLASGAVLNRYWDDVPEPRPESYREDEALGRTLPEGARRERFYRDVRAAAESGWDFSSRWMRDPSDLRTLETTAIAPVDLNALLHHAERTIAALRRHRALPGDSAAAARFDSLAAARRAAMLAAMWDEEAGFFHDVRWRTGEQVRDRPTMAAAAALHFGIATPEQGRRVLERLERDFLKPGGFVTTTIASGQQWDAPNGWPPLQWLAIEGARRYGGAALADTARARWLALNRRTYRATGKMTEKYDVVDLARRAGGGEYPTQDGFGWTNGVALALAAQEAARQAPVPARPAAPRTAARPAAAQRAGASSNR